MKIFIATLLAGCLSFSVFAAKQITEIDKPLKIGNEAEAAQMSEMDKNAKIVEWEKTTEGKGRKVKYFMDMVDGDAHDAYLRLFEDKETVNNTKVKQH